MEMACDVDVLILLFLSYMHFVIFFQNIPIISPLGNWKQQEESSWLTPPPRGEKTFQTAVGKFCHLGISPLGWNGEPVIPENSLRGTCFPGLISTCCQTRPEGASPAHLWWADDSGHPSKGKWHRSIPAEWMRNAWAWSKGGDQWQRSSEFNYWLYDGRKAPPLDSFTRPATLSAQQLSLDLKRARAHTRQLVAGTKARNKACPNDEHAGPSFTIRK